MTTTAPNTADRARLAATVHGAVQGVGFRPFVYRLARELHLRGWVANSPQGVLIEAEGEVATLKRFAARLQDEPPPRAIIQSVEFAHLEATFAEDEFEIRESELSGRKGALILPDGAPCTDCLRDIFDPVNRRYRYPFTNCTHCGPRFSIIEALPYDRSNTSMKAFAMCEECMCEYHDPADRRFHAQPNACPRCGPQLALWDEGGERLSAGDDALRAAAALLREGKIVALKGVGGFQLLVDAGNDEAVWRLRSRKRRPEKPLALLYPSLELLREDALISELEEHLLLSAEAPIVLLDRPVGPARLAPSVAPGNPHLGAMLPSSPLHHLLMCELGFPVIATSGNVSDEPICTDEHEALRRLAGLADAFLVHDRPIVRHVDDSIVRTMLGRPMILRRARGYAPLPVHLPKPLPCVLAVGAHLKNSVALSVGNEAFLSQHIGDLASAEAHAAFARAVVDLPRLYDAEPVIVACDWHPEYLSTKHARQGPAACRPVQHHWAHVLACLADNGLEPPALGVAWDGTGYGTDGTIWGGEFLLAKTEGRFERAAHFRTFRLPGGEAAIRQPRRSALGLLYELWGDRVFARLDLAPVRDCSSEELQVMAQMLDRQVQSPLTSSAGRFFDAMAALIGLRQCASFEGQAAMELEFAAEPAPADPYPFDLLEGAPRIVDWGPAVEALLQDLENQVPHGQIAGRLHQTLAEIVVAVARVACEERVILTGGCFQNRRLTELCVRQLRDAGFRPSWHQHVPPNDGGLALGQIYATALAVP